MTGRNRYPKEFYGSVPTVNLAQTLLGAHLVTCVGGVRTAGLIVEVEAYLGSDDPACHAARGKTPRNEVMFRTPGHCYVYLIYGMYHCVNVVSDPEGVGSAALIRAIEPIEGVDEMARRRWGGQSLGSAGVDRKRMGAQERSALSRHVLSSGVLSTGVLSVGALPKGRNVRELARGPGRLCQALGITKELSGQHFAESPHIWIEPGIAIPPSQIQSSGRIGISQGGELQLRFYIRGSRWVS